MVRPPLSKEELALINTPDSEIRLANRELSFDAERLSSRVSQGDPWQQVIQAHLYLDHVVGLMLTDALARPAAIDAKRLSFHQKLQLIDSMALLPEGVLGAIRLTNRVRNDIAHDLNFELTPSVCNKLVNSVPETLRRLARTPTPGVEPDPDISLSESLVVLILHCEIERKRHVVDRILARKSALVLRQVLDNVQHAVTKSEPQPD